MPERVTIDQRELGSLNERVRKLAGEKSYLQLIITMINKLNAVPGLESTVASMLRVMLDNIGGSNLIIYYRIDNAIYSTDIFGNKARLEEIDDPLVKKVFETHEPIEFEHDFRDTRMATPEFTKAATWIVPLLVGSELVGVLKMEGLIRISAEEWRQHFPVFINYAALVLKNEIMGHTQLQKAYEQLTRTNEELVGQIAERKRVENELRVHKDHLEETVAERTADLLKVNAELQQKIVERKQAERNIAILNFALSNVHEAAFLIDETGRFLYVNGESCRVLGYSRDEFLGMNVSDVDPDFPPERWVRHWQDLQTHHSLTFESRHTTKDGRILPVEVSASYIEYDGKGYNLALVRDVADRKRIEQDRLARIHFIESMDQVNRAIQGTNDLERMMSEVLSAALTIFECDRAFLLYPCDPQATSWRVPMERTRPEYPGALAMNLETPMNSSGIEVMQKTLAANSPVGFGPENECPLPVDLLKRFTIQSQLTLAIYPKVGKPWIFGMHQCSYPRAWSPEERNLFQEIGRRLTDGLTSLLAYRNLQESEERYRSIITAMAEGVVFQAASGEITAVNPAAEKIAGRTANEMIGRTLDRCFWQAIYEDGTRFPEGLHPSAVTLRTGKPQTNVVMGIYRPDRTLVWISINSEPLIAAVESKPYAVVTTFHDITERKRAEERNLHLAAIVEFSDDAIIGKTPEGIITSWNKGAERIYGYSEREMIGTPVSRLVPPEREEEVHRFLDLLASGQHIDHFETVRRRKDGQCIHVSLTLSPIRDANGKIIGVSTIGRDITERKRAEEEIRRWSEELERRVADRTRQLEVTNKELEAFSYSVSHDLKAPLRTACGFSQILMEDYANKLDEQARDYLTRIRGASERMSHLIEDLLKLSRITRGEVNRKNINLTALAQAILQDLQNSDPDRCVKVVIAPDLQVNADENLMWILMDNLLNNAWKFTRKVPKARIEVGQVRQEGRIVFFVRDNGAGFNEAYANKLFAPFQRLHAVTEFEGTGIGLSIVQRIIHRHGGQVWAQGAVGKGAAFFFTIP